MIRLTMTEEQAKIVSLACEFYARVRMGQFNEIVWRLLDIKIPSGEYCERREKAEQLLLEARKLLYPDLYGAGHSYGIGKFDDADLAYDVHRVIRHEMGDGRPPFSYHDLPICERVELPSSAETSSASPSTKPREQSSNAEKENPSIPEELEGICLRCGKKIDEEEKAFLDKDKPDLCVACAYGLNTEKSLRVVDVDKAVNLISSSAEKARIMAGRYCANCRYGITYHGSLTTVYCVKLNALHNPEFNCRMWENADNELGG